MPPRWPRKPDRNDPDYRRLDDRMNFALHVAIFAVVNSGLWFFRVLGDKSDLGVPGGPPWTPGFTAVWAGFLVAHAVFIFAIAKYNPPASSSTTEAGIGFQPTNQKKTTKSAK
ncbi:2TM domain-containing protein [Kovacikia minuta CCNUW1]|uniref:2TM domain-containing protein n=1 Tax=Kovacikia minuta TaxID=2931930 RepID=UPI001CD03983|nr:2TM domain-containing protein [Kovacikia minuta]UBF28289.1 2TM domain-containing protein [Kovacikia minuta CCNUW1]